MPDHNIVKIYCTQDLPFYSAKYNIGHFMKLLEAVS
jgi:hypothetical protein